MIVTVDRTNLLQAAMIHSISWKESHRFFCASDFVKMHTFERQREYIRKKMNCGSKFYMLVEDIPIGVVSVKECLIEDFYILPDKQKMGYGTKLLQFAIEQCTGIPTLWILENNTNAKRLYHKMGFQETGRTHTITEGIDEIELSLNSQFVVQ
ncbi:MAG: GNAT family N-acetyltransferase [Bacillota bacterium]|nr:GNAT family N-acetyltransferase [Bacillota bacterium]